MERAMYFKLLLVVACFGLFFFPSKGYSQDAELSAVQELLNKLIVSSSGDQIIAPLSQRTLSSREDIFMIEGVDPRDVHRRLEHAGFEPGSYDESNLMPLSEAIKRFQKLARLDETGIIDENTWQQVKKLYDPMEGRQNSESTAQIVRNKADSNERNNQPLYLENIALPPFIYDNHLSELSVKVNTFLFSELQKRGFNVVDKDRVKRTLRDEMSVETIADAENAERLGRALGSDAVIFGQLLDNSDSVRLVANIFHAGSGTIVSTAELDLNKSLVDSDVVKSNSPLKKTKSETKSILMNGYNFDLQSCKRTADQRLSCDFLVTSKEQDRWLKICLGGWRCDGQRSRMVDSLGNFFPAHFVQIGDKTTEEGGSIDFLFPSEIPIKMIMKFKGISENADKISLAEINCNEFKVQFRDILMSEK